jgi:acyl-CoA reductase-like NAD-dependent aldehyde dehydrogenase
MAARDIVASFAGCCGQRCMAASVLILVGGCDDVLSNVVEVASQLQCGQGAGQVGPLIDSIAKERCIYMIQSYVLYLYDSYLCDQGLEIYH